MTGINFTDSPKAIGEQETLADHIDLLGKAFDLLSNAENNIICAFDTDGHPADFDEVDLDKAIRCARTALLHLETVKFRVS